jgi:hypothetical protein
VVPHTLRRHAERGDAHEWVEAEGGLDVARGGARLAERMIKANGAELCTDSYGDPTDPPVLLIMGTGASMLWWPDAFCRTSRRVVGL